MISAGFFDRVQKEQEWPALAAQLPDRADALELFKMLALQRWLDLSDEALHSEVGDRLSLRRFCGFEPSAPLPPLPALTAFRAELESSRPGLLNAFVLRWSTRPLLSVVSPVYRAEGMVDELVRQVRLAVERVTSDFEIILVEDGSGDGTWARIAAACAVDARVKGIKLSRNFGQHQAITAGLEHARGTYVVLIDCDLQDDPSFIGDLYVKARQGFDVVLTAQQRRAQGIVRRCLARLFAGSLKWMDGERSAHWLVGGYSMLSRRAVDALLQIRDVHRHYLALVRWLGFPVAYVSVVHRPRHSGKSSYTAMKLVRHAVDGWISQSNRLLYMSVALGFSFLLTALAGVALVVVLYFVHGLAAGWPSLVVVVLTCTGAVLMSLGVIGIYLGKIFDQVRGRPLYVIERTINEGPSPVEPTSP